MSSSSFSPSEDQQSLPLRGSFSLVRVLLNEGHRTAKWWLRHAPSYPRKVQGNHCFSLCSWLSPQTTELKTTSLTCEAKLCSSSFPERVVQKKHPSSIYYFYNCEKAMILLSVYPIVSTQYIVLTCVQRPSVSLLVQCKLLISTLLHVSRSRRIMGRIAAVWRLLGS